MKLSSSLPVLLAIYWTVLAGLPLALGWLAPPEADSAWTPTWWWVLGGSLLGSGVIGSLGFLLQHRSAMASAQEVKRVIEAVAHGDYQSRTVEPSSSPLSREMELSLQSLQFEVGERERLLRENSHQLSSILASLSAGVIAIDAQRRVLFANRASALLMDVAYQDLHQRPFYELLRSPFLEEAVEEVFQTQSSVSTEIESIRPQRRVLSVQLTRIAADQGDLVVIVLHDVTSLRQLETMRRDFVANVSHELKTPLSSIKAYSETLRLGAIDDPHNRLKFVERIEEQANRLSELIIDLIQLARIESGLATFELNDIDLCQVARQRLEEFYEQAAKRRLHLRCTTEPATIVVRCDIEGLVTILDNLISNAVKYTPEGGGIEVRCRLDGDMGLLEVVDNGTGIAPEHQERIFERFYRVDKARTSHMGGTGLGLAIVKHLAQAFSGQVSLSSRLGKGSTFSVRLPLATKTS